MVSAPLPVLHPEAHIPDAYPGEILRGTIGSTLHGLAVPGLDLPFEQHIYRSAGGSNPSRPGDVDLVVYGMRKFLRLALSGNPTVLNLFFVPAEHLMICTSEGRELQSMAPGIVSAEAGTRYLGYALQQRERMLGIRGQKRSGKIRQELIDAHGFDTKYAMHMVRLGLQGIELLSTGRITFPMSEPERSTVYAIRNGNVSQDDALRLAQENEARLQALIDTPRIPVQPDRAAVQTWLFDTYRKHWALDG